MTNNRGEILELDLTPKASVSASWSTSTSSCLSIIYDGSQTATTPFSFGPTPS